LLSFLFPLSGYAQDSTKSAVFKEPLRLASPEWIRGSDIDYQLWEGFMLMRRANDGDPVAQHELGLRYLLGKGFPVDTTRAAYWIGKAAEQNMSLAQYNYGVFLNNGWGVKWNPFEAFRWFQLAAVRQLPEAEFVLGLFYTDNLVVPRNWTKAYQLVKASADQNYEPAQKVLQEFIKRGLPIQSDSTAASLASRDSSATQDVRKSAGASGDIEPVFLDFGADTSSQIDDLTLLKEAFREGNEKFREALGVSKMFESGGDTTGIGLIEQAANVGSPEALTLLGRCYEKGVGVPRDRILAAEQYLRAARMDSRRATVLLVNLMKEKSFLDEVESRTQKNDDDAAFVWAGLVELGLNQAILNDQAFHLLVVAASHGNIPSLIELGRCYFTGQWTTQNPLLGEQTWLRAAGEGSRDAEIRLAAAKVLSDTSSANSDSSGITQQNSTDTSLAVVIRILTAGSNDGSIVAQLALGYCYEKGIGVPRNTPEAAKIYRDCAQRGSQSAYESLKRLYDRIRPKDKEFDVSDVNSSG
jgi:TPR repeat protein